MSKAGAQAAYRGYRVQALYILNQILTQGAENYIFQPEGHEDLDILDSKSNLLEAVQVKSYPSLKFSDLADSDASANSKSSVKVDPFWVRAINLLKDHNAKTVNLVNFGQIGTELEQAWLNVPLPENSKAKKTKRDIVADKLRKCEFSDRDIDLIFSKVKLISLDESKVQSEVTDLIKDTCGGISPENAFDLFMYWIYLVSEQQRKITKIEIIQKLNNIGKFLAACHAHRAEWSRSIHPVESKSLTEQQKTRLSREFYEGVSVRYDHILTGLDFYRENKIAEIQKSFQEKNIVIIHAASGQGKSTLAYRYLHDHYPDKWRFLIEFIEDRQHAVSIATALNGHASALESPMIVYLDVRPTDTAWPELIGQLSGNNYIKILVTVREEDFRRANLPIFELDFEDIDLEFNQDEARLIFERATEYQVLHSYLDFQEAWDAFGGKGPLMEFVFLLTQTETLQKRLKGQILRIRNDVRKKNLPDELKLLRLVAVATAYEVRISTKELIESLDLPDPNLTLDFFEQEYLIRQSFDKKYIGALHPVRSQILVDLLTDKDIFTWSYAAKQVLPFIFEEDLETFFLYAFVDKKRHEDYQELLNVIFEFRPSTWTGIGGILRALLWAGVRDYIRLNKDTVQSLKKIGNIWWWIFDFELTSESDNSMLDHKFFWKHIPDKKMNEIIKIKHKQRPKSEAFRLATDWLKLLDGLPKPLSFENDWTNLAEVIYWIAIFKIDHQIEKWVSDSQLNKAATDLPLNILADLSMALYVCDRQQHEKWMDIKISEIENRVSEEYQILAFEETESDNSLKIHFLTSFTDDDDQKLESDSSDPLNATTMQCIDIVNRLFPKYKKYASQGYGHKLGNMKLPLDSTIKNIPRENLKPHWSTNINRIAMGLGRADYRPDNWFEYVKTVIEIRKKVILSLNELQQGIPKYFAKKKPLKLYGQFIGTKAWDECRDQLCSLPKFPKNSIDKWGFVSEYSKDIFQQEFIPKAIILQKYKPYLELQRKYFGSLRDFFSNSVHVITENSIINKKNPQIASSEILLGSLQKKGLKTGQGHLSTRNLWEAVRSIDAYQTEFRKLFGNLIDPSELRELEKVENELLRPVWQLWYFYANYPQKIISQATKNIPIRISSEKRKLEKRISSALSELNSEKVQIKLLDTRLNWDNQSSIWIKMDIHNPFVLYNLFSGIVLKLKVAFGHQNFKALKSYIIEDGYEYIIIVPFIRGKMINSLVWPLKTMITLFSTNSMEDKPYLYVMKSIKAEIQKALGLKIWDIEDIQMANQLWESFNQLRIFSAQIAELKVLPESESVENCSDTLKGVSKKFSEFISRSLQNFIDSKNILLTRFQKLTETEQDSRKNLFSAALTVHNISSQIVPLTGEQKKSMDVDDIVEYSKNLKELATQIEAARLWWITDVLDQVQA